MSYRAGWSKRRCIQCFVPGFAWLRCFPAVLVSSVRSVWNTKESSYIARGAIEVRFELRLIEVLVALNWSICCLNDLIIKLGVGRNNR